MSGAARLSGFCSLLLGIALSTAAHAQEGDPTGPPGMSGHRLDELVRRIDDQAERVAPNQWRFKVSGRNLALIIDEQADRMRIMTPVVEAKNLDEEVLRRLLQANYDSALDARYALAQGVLWSVFIHPLSELTERFFLSGVGQVVNTAETFGTAYSSGVLLFGGGDSGAMQRELLENLLKLLDRQRT